MEEWEKEIEWREKLPFFCHLKWNWSKQMDFFEGFFNLCNEVSELSHERIKKFDLFFFIFKHNQKTDNIFSMSTYNIPNETNEEIGHETREAA
jgi:hypothetical protein